MIGVVPLPRVFGPLDSCSNRYVSGDTQFMKDTFDPGKRSEQVQACRFTKLAMTFTWKFRMQMVVSHVEAQARCSILHHQHLSVRSGSRRNQASRVPPMHLNNSNNTKEFNKVASVYLVHSLWSSCPIRRSKSALRDTTIGLRLKICQHCLASMKKWNKNKPEVLKTFQEYVKYAETHPYRQACEGHARRQHKSGDIHRAHCMQLNKFDVQDQV
jgi:hypothetical protein